MPYFLATYLIGPTILKLIGFSDISGASRDVLLAALFLYTAAVSLQKKRLSIPYTNVAMLLYAVNSIYFLSITTRAVDLVSYIFVLRENFTTLIFFILLYNHYRNMMLPDFLRELHTFFLAAGVLTFLQTFMLIGLINLDASLYLENSSGSMIQRSIFGFSINRTHNIFNTTVGGGSAIFSALMIGNILVAKTTKRVLLKLLSYICALNSALMGLASISFSFFICIIMTSILYVIITHRLFISLLALIFTVIFINTPIEVDKGTRLTLMDYYLEWQLHLLSKFDTPLSFLIGLGFDLKTSALDTVRDVPRDTWIFTQLINTGIVGFILFISVIFILLTSLQRSRNLISNTDQWLYALLLAIPLAFVHGSGFILVPFCTFFALALIFQQKLSQTLRSNIRPTERIL